MTTPESIAKIMHPADQQQQRIAASSIAEQVAGLSDRLAIDYLVELEFKIRTRKKIKLYV